MDATELQAWVRQRVELVLRRIQQLQDTLEQQREDMTETQRELNARDLRMQQERQALKTQLDKQQAQVKNSNKFNQEQMQQQLDAHKTHVESMVSKTYEDIQLHKQYMNNDVLQKMASVRQEMQEAMNKMDTAMSYVGESLTNMTDNLEEKFAELVELRQDTIARSAQLDKLTSRFQAVMKY